MGDTPSSDKPSRLFKPYYRNGDNHRSGADVSFADIVKLFGFRKAEIGKWVSKEEQQIAANLMFDALCDLMDILQVPEAVISLNGTLSLAFGKGGNKHSSAHYNPQTRTLALAKNAGGGALAHEWFHGFDHYICPRVFSDVSPQEFASICWLKDLDAHPHPLNDKLSQMFRWIFLTPDGEKPNRFVQRATEIDQKLSMFYYARPQELAARAFEATIQHHPLKNNFLVQGTKQSQEAKLGIYPEERLLQPMSAAISDYFYRLGRAVTASGTKK